MEEQWDVPTLEQTLAVRVSAWSYRWRNGLEEDSQFFNRGGSAVRASSSRLLQQYQAKV